MATDVQVIILTYNQQQTIVQAIESVLQQQTTFAVSIIVSDDASTDATVKLVQQLQQTYPFKITLLTSEINRGVAANFLKCLQQIKAPYIAICDGDDYWIDVNKLQHQVTILNQQRNIGLVATQAQFLDVQTQHVTVPSSFNTSYKSFTFEQIISKNPFTTSTIVFRKTVLDEFFQYYSKHQRHLKEVFDYTLWIYFSFKAKSILLSKCTTVYRRSPLNYSQNPDFKKQWEFQKFFYNQCKFYLQQLAIAQHIKQKIYYQKAIQLYILALNNHDTAYLSKFKKQFIIEKDYVRCFLIVISTYMPTFIHLARYYEILIVKLKHKHEPH